ncbi:hypothetical protein BDE36_3986 [Arcticibacter tournemirensis]|nr:hypothetical protein BDE36_3986 [Arcticibacter tournemirensis]
MGIFEIMKPWAENSRNLILALKTHGVREGDPSN